MTDQDQLNDIQAKVDSLVDAVANISVQPAPAASIDFTPVLTAIAGVQTGINALLANWTATPAPASAPAPDVASAPDSAPATAA